MLSSVFTNRNRLTLRLNISKGGIKAKRIERFEDFTAWQKARKLTAEIYKVTNQERFARDFGLKDQIRRAAISSMSNLAEGFERGRWAEFHSFFRLRKGRV